MHKELMGAKMDQLTNGSNKQEIKIIKQIKLMRKAVTPKEEEKEVKQFNQIQRTKIILLDLLLEVEMNN